MIAMLKYGKWFLIQGICSALLIMSSLGVERLFGKQYNVLNITLYFLLILSIWALVLVWKAVQCGRSLGLIHEASVFPIISLVIFVFPVLPIPGTSGFVSTLSETMVGFVIISQAEALWKIHCDLSVAPFKKTKINFVMHDSRLFNIGATLESYMKKLSVVDWVLVVSYIAATRLEKLIRGRARRPSLNDLRPWYLPIVSQMRSAVEARLMSFVAIWFVGILFSFPMLFILLSYVPHIDKTIDGLERYQTVIRVGAALFVIVFGFIISYIISLVSKRDEFVAYLASLMILACVYSLIMLVFVPNPVLLFMVRALPLVLVILPFVSGMIQSMAWRWGALKTIEKRALCSVTWRMRLQTVQILLMVFLVCSWAVVLCRTAKPEYLEVNLRILWDIYTAHGLGNL